MKYYKVVRETVEGRYISAWFWSNTAYSTTKWTKPEIPNSKLFVFNDLDLARKYKEHIGWQGCGLRIFECNVRGVEKCNLPAQPNRRSISRFWNIVKSFNRVPTEKDLEINGVFVLSPFPQGTYLASSVKLKKEVK